MSFVKVVTPDTVKQQQQDIAADLRTLQDAVNKCSLSDATSVQWHATTDRISAFLAQEPSWLSTAAQADEGDAIQTDMASWHTRLQQAGCDAGPAPTQANKPFDLGTTLRGLFDNPIVPLIILLLVSRGKWR